MRAILRFSLLAVTLVSTSLCAWSLPCGCQPFEGYYAGAAIGVATNMADHKSTAFVRYNALIVNPPDTLLTAQADVYRIRPWGEIYGGWGARFCNWIYLGGRFGINFSSFRVAGPTAVSRAVIDEPTIPPPFAATLKHDVQTKAWSVEYTLDFKPGIVWCDQTMLFGIVGAAFNRTTLNGTSRFTFTDLSNGQDFASALNLRGRNGSAGLRGGLGLEQMLTYCLSIHLTYVYTSYWNLEAKGRGDTQTQLGVLANGHNARFRSRARKQVTSIGLSYYF